MRSRWWLSAATAPIGRRPAAAARLPARPGQEQAAAGRSAVAQNHPDRAHQARADRGGLTVLLALIYVASTTGFFPGARAAADNGDDTVIQFVQHIPEVQSGPPVPPPAVGPTADKVKPSAPTGPEHQRPVGQRDHARLEPVARQREGRRLHRAARRPQDRHDVHAGLHRLRSDRPDDVRLHGDRVRRRRQPVAGQRGRLRHDADQARHHGAVDAVEPAVELEQPDDDLVVLERLPRRYRRGRLRRVPRRQAGRLR